MIAYVLMVWFVYFLLNYAEITARPTKWLKRVLGSKLGYPLSCPLCLCFWLTAVLVPVTSIPLWWVFVAPVLHLFVDLAYQKLSDNAQHEMRREVREAWNSARNAGGQTEAFRILERMVERIGYGRYDNAPIRADVPQRIGGDK